MRESEKRLAEALKKAGSAPLLVNIVSRRVRQLQRGAPPLIEMDDPSKVAQEEIAIREFIEGKIGYRERALENGQKSQ